MVPKAKDLKLVKWRKLKCFYESWDLVGVNGLTLGHINWFGEKQDEVSICARISNKMGPYVEVPLKNGVFNYQDYIPEWESCMDSLLATIFK